MNQRGSTLIEGVVAVGFIVALVSATLTAAYAAFGRAFIEYRSEQALYCLAEGQRSRVCRQTLERSIRRALPIGRVTNVKLRKGRDQWSVKFSWRLSRFQFSIDKTLSRRRILRGVLRS